MYKTRFDHGGVLTYICFDPCCKKRRGKTCFILVTSELFAHLLPIISCPQIDFRDQDRSDFTFSIFPSTIQSLKKNPKIAF